MSAVVEFPEETVYDTDFYAWTQRQAELLRQLRVTATPLPAEIDIENIAEEIETLGRSDLFAVESLIRNIFIHTLKLCSVPDASPANHWKVEALNFAFELSQKYAPSMRRKLSLQKNWDGARRLARAQLAAYENALVDGIPETCPFSLRELIEGDFDIDAIVKRLDELRFPHAH